MSDDDMTAEEFDRRLAEATPVEVTVNLGRTYTRTVATGLAPVASRERVAEVVRDLRPILEAYRTEVQPHWSPATAYAAFPSRPGEPDGQCGVTSAWLLRRLAEDHGITALFAEGTAYHLGDDDELDHCWLEIGDGWNRIIVDLTADQIDGLRDRPIVCATSAELCGELISYIPKQRLTAEQLAADPIQGRLAVLALEVGR